MPGRARVEAGDAPWYHSAARAGTRASAPRRAYPAAETKAHVPPVGSRKSQANMCECAVKLLSAAGWNVHAVSVGHDARWACPASTAASSRAACCWFRLPAQKTTAREHHAAGTLLLNFKSEKRASREERLRVCSALAYCQRGHTTAEVRSGAWLIGSGWVLRSSRVSVLRVRRRSDCTTKKRLSWR